ncbi:hypothetical protein EVG20_g7866 [Dentipellis fragilis]|uniref:Uncharacterized protein n=1 Tax=Dentipellis fragilis TaxID=205917 RepID=A0A4Y9YB07_9AGAM|nr:hypothetical protein EVG20_g7866 [Dentipellis fragilis]
MSLAYPEISRDRVQPEHLRTGHDLMMLFFVFDEYTDCADAATVRIYADIVMDAIKNTSKPRPKDEVLLGEVARQFWALAEKTSSKTSPQRFIKIFTEYTDSVVDQVIHRDADYIPTVDEFLAVRRRTISVEPPYVPFELGFDLPTEFFEDPRVGKLYRVVIGLVIVGNRESWVTRSADLPANQPPGSPGPPVSYAADYVSLERLAIGYPQDFYHIIKMDYNFPSPRLFKSRSSAALQLKRSQRKHILRRWFSLTLPLVIGSIVPSPTDEHQAPVPDLSIAAVAGNAPEIHAATQQGRSRDANERSMRIRASAPDSPLPYAFNKAGSMGSLMEDDVIVYLDDYR